MNPYASSAANPYGTAEEKKRLSRRSGWLCASGILAIFCAGFVLGISSPSGSASPSGATSASEAIVFVGAALWIVLWLAGTCTYAKSKGYSPFVGILGIMTIFGIIALVLLPDKWKKALAVTPSTSGPGDLTNYPR